jgi:UTP--glucose-1-phosphate uridylyltransferase
MKAVIPAAGLGTRFLPATKASPKEMLPVVDKPAIQHVVEECVASGIREVCIVTGRGKRAIEDHFDQAYELERLLEQKGDRQRLEQMRAISEMADIYYVRQKSPKGLGHAVAAARSFVAGEPFAVLLGDDIMESSAGTAPCTRQLIDWRAKVGGSVVAVERVPRDRLSSYGVVKTGGEVKPGLHAVLDLVEKPAPEEAPSDLGIMGRYVLDGSVMDCLARIQPGRGGEYQLTDALRLSVKDGSPMHAWRFEGQRHDLGHKLGWLMANVEYGLRDPDVGPQFRAYLSAKGHEP